MHALDDTIAAIATAPGAAGLAVVRVSGGRALAIADRVFRGAAPLEGAGSHTLHHGWAARPAAGPGAADDAGGPRLDEVVAAVFRAPRSYTREDVVEISCHGGRFAAESVLDALVGAGARPARPGEFTLRAFLNGRIDLAQAEAVADLIHAESEAAHRLALAHLAGGLSRRVRSLSDRVADGLCEVEARVDFAEDVGGIEVPASVIGAIEATAAELGLLLEGSEYARAVREGLRVPLVGRPNVGKSSLFNALVGEERAIVTDVPGTTRDRVSEPVEIAGVRVVLSDTAGLRETPEPVEAIGIARAEEALRDAAAVVWVVDASVPLEAEDARIASRLGGRPAVVALNKSDLGRAAMPDGIAALFDGGGAPPVAVVSAVTGDGIEGLRDALAGLLGAPGPMHLAVSNRRHIEALTRARAALGRAAACGREGQPGEIVALELRESLAALGEVTGESVGEDLLDRIFSRFCIGK